MNQPELIITSQPIDFELSELLGIAACDFLVLCFDGVQLEFFGTPYDTPTNRIKRQGLVDALNDRSSKSLWPEMFKNWKGQICKQFTLSNETTEKEFRPVVSYKISRVCHGYSEHLHCAIGLFETLNDQIERWKIAQFDGGKCSVEILSKTGGTFSLQGRCMPKIIALTVVEMLRSNRHSAIANPK